jgi:tetratricopeptide (TPR) repeat protein
MMKHNVAIATGLASLLVLPTALGQQDVAQLDDALREISHALEVMTGIEQQIQAQPERGIDLVLSATEVPHLEQRELDGRLDTLRNEVSLLQMELDALDSPGMTMTLQPFVPSGPAPDALGRMADPSRAGALATGLDDSLRATLSNRQASRSARSGQSSSRTASNPTHDPAHDPAHDPTRDPSYDPSRQAPEFEGYTADPLGQARTCYRVGQYQRGFDLLVELEDLEALYWKARCLERLERLDEAIALLNQIVTAEPDSYQGQRAAKDLEFYEWKKQFMQKLPTGMQSRRREG